VVLQLLADRLADLLRQPDCLDVADATDGATCIGIIATRSDFALANRRKQ